MSAALVLGCAWGSVGEPFRPSVVLSLALLALAALVARVARGRGLALAPGGLSLSWLVLLACLGAASAASAVRTPGESQLLERGRWKEQRAAGGSAWGKLDGHGQQLVVPVGTVAADEEMVVLGTGRCVRRARGFDAAGLEHAARAPVARVELEVDELQRVAPAPRTLGKVLLGPLEEVRRAGIERLGSIEDEDTRALVRALLFGECSTLSSALADLFTRTGARHLLALSGMHVALVAWWIVRPGSRWLCAAAWPWPGGRLHAACIGEAGIVLLLVGVWGSQAPVTRAGVAWVVAALAPLVSSVHPQLANAGRRPDPLSLLAFATLGECLVDPLAVRDVSLQLSYSATLGLILGYGRTHSALRRLVLGMENPFALGGRFHAWPTLLRVLVAKLIGVALGSLAASLVACLATLPVAWCTFGECTWAALPATLLSLPPMLLLMLGGLLELAFQVPVPGLTFVARAWIALLSVLDAFPGTPSPLPARPALWIALVGMGWLGWIAGRARRGTFLGRSIAVLTGVLLLPWSLDPAQVEIRALDVGHGTCVHVRLPGARDWIFDAGSIDRPGLAREAIAPTLRRFEVSELSILASHAHRDHAGALGWISERWPVRSWVGAGPAHSSVRGPHVGERYDLGSGVLELCAGVPSDGIRIDVLRGWEGPGNEGSRAVLVSAGGERALLLGDAEGPGLAALLAQRRVQGPLRMLIAPHHGSSTPWLHELLETTRPAEVWISTSGEGPPIGTELDRRGIPWRWTARDGPLGVFLGMGGGQ